jgi:hypothetical protein
MIKPIVLFLLGVSVGGFGRDAARLAWGRYMSWRMERDYQLAVERLSGCRHARTVLTDCGMGLVTPKCVDCLALHMPPSVGPVGLHGRDGWCANSATIEEAQKLTRELQNNRGPS